MFIYTYYLKNSTVSKMVDSIWDGVQYMNVIEGQGHKILYHSYEFIKK